MMIECMTIGGRLLVSVIKWEFFVLLFLLFFVFFGVNRNTVNFPEVYEARDVGWVIYHEVRYQDINWVSFCFPLLFGLLALFF